MATPPPNTTHNPTDFVHRWTQILQAAAGPAIALDAQTVNAFADELGHRRSIDPYLLAWRAHRLGVDLPAPPPPATLDHDVRLWHALATHNPDAADAVLASAESLPRTDTDAGALFPQVSPQEPSRHLALEVWTEVELASLHALLWLHTLDPSRGYADRAAGAIAFHLERLQPDNATNHPWAIHCFILAGCAHNGADPGAEMYAQTLLHNCQVSLGEPDAFSKLILADAGDALSAHR